MVKGRACLARPLCESRKGRRNSPAAFRRLPPEVPCGACFVPSGPGPRLGSVLALQVSTRPALAGFAGMDQGALRPRRGVDPEAGVESLAGVGPKVAERLGRLGSGLRTVRDVVEHIPRDFLDWQQASGFGALMAGEEATVTCTVDRARVRPTRRRNLKIVEAQVRDESGSRVTAIWFNQAYLAEQLQPGTRLLLHGRLEGSGYGPATFKVERHERAEAGAGLHTVGLVPVYPASEEIATGRLREIADRALALARFFPDPLPAALMAEEALPPLADALLAAHQPRERGEAEAARRRLAFQELLVLQLGLRRRRAEAEEGAVAPALGEDGELDRALPRAPAVHADTRAGGSRARDRPGSRPASAHAAAPPGRRRLGEDGRRALRAPARRRGRAPGRAHGADRDARRAALPHGRADLQRPRRARPAPHELARSSRGDARAGRVCPRRGRPRDRDARPHPGVGRLPLARGRRRRRAAPLRRRAAARARLDRRRTSST